MLMPGDRHSEVNVPEPIGNIGLTEDSNILLAALKRAVVLFDLTKQSIVRYYFAHFSFMYICMAPVSSD